MMLEKIDNALMRKILWLSILSFLSMAIWYYYYMPSVVFFTHGFRSDSFVQKWYSSDFYEAARWSPLTATGTGDKDGYYRVYFTSGQGSSSIHFSADDCVKTIYLDGILYESYTCGACTHCEGFDWTTPPLQAGRHLLAFEVVNSGGGYTGYSMNSNALDGFITPPSILAVLSFLAIFYLVLKAHFRLNCFIVCERSRELVFMWSIIILCFFLSYLFMMDRELYIDEILHVPQIVTFTHGDYVLNPGITVARGYHLLMASVSYLFNNSSLHFLRLVTTCLSFLSVVVFFLISDKLDRDSSTIKTLQYAFFPIFFPYFFFVYTDTVSLLFVLIGLFFVINGKNDLAAMFAILAMVIRQNNILWLVFLMFLAVKSPPDGLGHYPNFIPRKRPTITLIWLVTNLNRAKLFFAGIILFLVFLYLNHGQVGLGDLASHPSFSFHLGNIYFCLFLFFILFLPINLSNIVTVSLATRWDKVLVLCSLCIVFSMPFFQNDHWYNKITADILNVPLVFFTKNITLKMIFSIPVILSIFSLSKVELHDRRYLLLYPFTFIFLGLSWLIEQRYYIIPIVLFLIFRKMDLSRGKIRIEYLTLMAYIALAMMLFFGVVSNKFAI